MNSYLLMIDFIAQWAREDLVRPLLILVSGMLVFNLPTVLYKVRITIRGLVYFFLCWDKSWKKPQDPGAIFGSLEDDEAVARKTIYFVRHGESCWNDTFNKGKHRSTLFFVLGFIPGLIKALLFELYLILSGKLDSWFYDSPISNLGISQAEELAQFLKGKSSTTQSEKDHLKILRADPGAPASKILCSNLRRAISTLACAFRERLRRRPDDKIQIIPSLQEISRNPDTLSITPPYTTMQASWVENTNKTCNFQKIISSHTDMSLHTGDKPLNTNGLKRMIAFCDFCFSSDVKEENIIVGGHSIWFRSFFKTFLPYAMPHACKTKKIVNAGVVAFDLLKVETKRGPKYMVDTSTITVVHGGFA